MLDRPSVQQLTDAGSARPASREERLGLRCLIADRSTIFALGLEAALRSEHVSIVGCVDDPANVDAFVRGHVVDVILSCYEPASESLNLARTMEACPVLVLSSLVADELLVEAVRAGARGLMTKDASGAELVAALAHVARGGTVLPAGWESVMPRIIEAQDRKRRGDTLLTRRERQVLQHLVLGKSNKQVARELGIAEQTVKNHVRHLMAKVGVSSRVQLCRWALQKEHGTFLEAEEPGAAGPPLSTYERTGTKIS